MCSVVVVVVEESGGEGVARAGGPATLLQNHHKLEWGGVGYSSSYSRGWGRRVRSSRLAPST